MNFKTRNTIYIVNKNKKVFFRKDISTGKISAPEKYHEVVAICGLPAKIYLENGDVLTTTRVEKYISII